MRGAPVMESGVQRENWRWVPEARYLGGGVWKAKVVGGVAGGLWGLSWGLVGVSGAEPESLGWAWELKEQIGSGVWKAKIEGDGDGGLWERNLKCRRGLWRGFVVLEQGLENWGRGG